MNRSRGQGPRDHTDTAASGARDFFSTNTPWELNLLQTFSLMDETMPFTKHGLSAQIGYQNSQVIPL